MGARQFGLAAKTSLVADFKKNPILYGVIIVLVLIVIVMAVKWVVKKVKGEGFAGSSNLVIPGNNSLWWHGSGDAGWGGSVHREATPHHVGHYDPNVRAATQPHQASGYGCACPSGSYEHATNGSNGSCPTGTRFNSSSNTCVSTPTCPTGTVYDNNSGSCYSPTTLVGDAQIWNLGQMIKDPTSTCNDGWSTTAQMEAQALAQVGSLQHDNMGEDALQMAINAAYDTGAGLTDSQLSSLMHTGSTSP